MAVYIAMRSHDGMVKIGKSDNPKKRLVSISSEFGCRMILLRVIDGSLPHERWVHQRFGDSKVFGEWFRFDADMMSFVIPDGFQCEIDYVGKTVTPKTDKQKRLHASMASIKKSLVRLNIPHVSEQTGVSVKAIRKMQNGLGHMPSEADILAVQSFLTERNL